MSNNKNWRTASTDVIDGDALKALLKDYINDPNNFSVTREVGPLDRIVGYHSENDGASWVVTCDFPDIPLEHITVYCGPLLGWVWARMNLLAKAIPAAN